METPNLLVFLRETTFDYMRGRSGKFDTVLSAFVSMGEGVGRDLSAHVGGRKKEILAKVSALNLANSLILDFSNCKPRTNRKKSVATGLYMIATGKFENSWERALREHSRETKAKGYQRLRLRTKAD